MTFIDNVLVFILFSVAITLISIRIPVTSFHYNSRLFKERKWERKGAVYQSLFHIKKWKNKLPQLSDFFKKLFSKKQVLNSSPEYLYRFVLETCRAEFTHWAIIASSFLFILWDGICMSVFMICAASVLNLPYVMIQRYNRPRILKILGRHVVLRTVGEPLENH